MNRRDFIRQAGAFSLLVAAVPTSLASTLPGQEKLELIDELRTFIKSQLQLNIAAGFYRKWNEEDSPWTYVLYFSESHKITPAVFDAGYAFVNPVELKETVIKYRPSGYHHLVYKTAGTSKTRLSQRLLSYAPEDLAFVAFHEALHQHFHRNRRKLPLEIEEAACDVMGNFASLLFAERLQVSNSDSYHQGVQQKENLANIINRYTRKVEKRLPAKSPDRLYQRCQREIRNRVGVNHLFNQDRYLYPVNNAYFLRFRRYCLCYFVLKEMLQDLNYDLQQWVKQVEDMKGKQVERCRELIASVA